MKQNQKKVVSSDVHRKKLSDSHLDPNSYFQKWMKSEECHIILCDAWKNMNPDVKKERNRKLRINTINRIERHCLITGKRMMPNHNSNACKIIDSIGLELGYNFIHAENGGEFRVKSKGYIVDGYDKKNVVIEYYEPRHYSIYRINKDKIRQLEIMNFLKCTFIIIDGRTDTYEIFKYNEIKN